MDPNQQKVIQLVKHACKGTTWTVKDMLEHCLNNFEDYENHKKAIILFLDDSGQEYDISFAQAGLKGTEALALLNVMAFKYAAILTGVCEKL